MARILLSVVPASGHVNPMLAIGQALHTNGHTVAFTTAEMYQEQIERAGFQFYAMAYPAGAVEAIHEAFRQPARWSSQFSPQAPQSYFFRDLPDLVASIITAIEDFKPDVLANDGNQYAGPIAADACGIPYSNFFAIVNPLLSKDAPPFGLGLTWKPTGHPYRWLWKLLRMLVYGVMLRHDLFVNRVRRRYGLKSRWGNLLAPSPYLTLIATTDDYEYPRRDLGRQVMYVGPVTTAQRGEVHDDFPWEWLAKDDRPTFYVSMGTIVRGDKIFRYVIELAKKANWKAVIAVGRGTDPAQFEPLPDNILLRQFVPQLKLMQHIDAMVSHGGNNTVSEALLHGLPLVVIPVSADQPDSAGHVVACGAGLRLSPWRVTQKQLGDAMDTLLHEPTYREAAQRIQASYQLTAGAQTCAKLIGLLAEHHKPLMRSSKIGPTILADNDLEFL